MSKRRIITAREQAAMAEPFLREAAEDFYHYVLEHPGIADDPMSNYGTSDGPAEPHSEETYRHLDRIRKNPNVKVPIYRPMPHSEQAWQGYHLGNGDTVSTSYDHAVHSARSAFGDDGWIIAHTWVPANQLGATRSINEWKYAGGPQTVEEHPKSKAERKHRQRMNEALQVVIARQR